MAQDINVKQIEFLQAYISRLQDYKAFTMGGGALIDKRLREIVHDIDSSVDGVTGMVSSSQRVCENLESRYNYATNECGEMSREVIGYSDRKAESKMDELEELSNKIRRDVQDFHAKMERMGQTTSTYARETISLLDNSNRFLMQFAQSLEQAVNIKIK